MLSLRTRMSKTSFTFASSFNPHLYGTLQLWLRPEAFSGLNNDDVISTWPDSSGNTNDATQSSVSLKPLYKTNVLNGFAAAYFDITNDSLVTPAVIGDAVDYTIFVVYNMNPTASGFHRAIQGSSNWLIGPYSGYHQMYNGGFISGPAISTSFVYATVVNDSNMGADFRINGVSQGTNGNTNGPGTIYLGGGNVFFDECLQGNIVEVLTYTTKLTSPSIASVEGYLVSKYAL